MKKIIGIILFFILGQNIFAQSGWSIINRNSQYGFSYYSFLNEQTGFASRYSWAYAYKTTDGGYTWQDLHSEYPHALVNDLLFLNESTGFLAHNILRRTTNGGTNWEIFDNIGFVAGLKMHSGGLFACGTKISKSTDYGSTWISLFTLDSAGSISRISFIDNNTGFACGYKNQRSILLKTTNAGNNWAAYSVNNELKTISDIKFMNQTTGIYTGTNLNDSAVFYTTTDGGNMWRRAGNEIRFIGSAFIDYAVSNVVYITGSKSLYKSTNFGENFFSVYNAEGLWASFFFNQNMGILSGNDTSAFLAKTTSGGVWVTQLSSEIPDKYSLSQNYPNPFNPSTKINYELKITNYVTLKIFDLLGKEVASLVNEKQNAGSYAVDFNSAEYNLPSGIYFYTLSTGEFKETRKMVLVK